jgi:Protein of unknown function (DUF2911)
MKQSLFRKLFGIAIVLLLTVPLFAQTQSSSGEKKVLSPPAQAKVELSGNTVTIDYSAPSMRGRKIVGGLVPYGKVWRTGANAATTLKTPVALHIGDLAVPAGTYTIYTLPSESGWTLIVNKQTGQWGTVYDEKEDLGRVPMKAGTVTSPAETFAIHFDKTSGKKTQLHLTWENTDVYVPVSVG